jgi:hypothetical protein
LPVKLLKYAKSSDLGRWLLARAIQIIQITLYIFSPETAVASGSDAQREDSPFITPTSQGIGMNIQKVGYLLYRQQIIRRLIGYHVFSSLQLTPYNPNGLF